MDKFEIKDDYTLSNCCSPRPHDLITGYYSHDMLIKIHQKNCKNLEKVDPQRLISLDWDDILCRRNQFKPDDDYKNLSELDFAVLQHHIAYGIDYSLVVARKQNITKQQAFDIHNKLRELNLIERVEAKIVQYRKGIVDNKWIKHRNHTYYDITEKGKNYLTYYYQNK
ncbi:MAG: DUF2250 domain-containing protein [Calditrichaeota bacterium]|nr:MAG: DUF2250 domain-containing protein [Calditrichota bacterium]